MKIFEYISLLPECRRCKNKNVCEHKPWLHNDNLCNYVIEHYGKGLEYNIKNKLDMKWNVYRYNINSRRIESYNIFDHVSFYTEVKAIIDSEYTKKQFSDRLKRTLMYYFWSKAEWEVLVSPFIGEDNATEKIDVYQQVMNNWDQFLSYCWGFKENK